MGCTFGSPNQNEMKVNQPTNFTNAQNGRQNHTKNKSSGDTKTVQRKITTRPTSTSEAHKKPKPLNSKVKNKGKGKKTTDQFKKKTITSKGFRNNKNMPKTTSEDLLSENDNGLPEPDEEYRKANEDIWKKYIADRK